MDIRLFRLQFQRFLQRCARILRRDVEEIKVLSGEAKTQDTLETRLTRTQRNKEHLRAQLERSTHALRQASARFAAASAAESAGSHWSAPMASVTLPGV